MAEKRTIELEIKENFKQVEKDLNSLDKALDNTANSARDVNKSFEDVYGDLQPLTARMGEAEDRLYELAAAGDYTSNEYKNLLNTVGEYRKVQINTDLAVDAASMTLSQKLGGALGGVASGFDLAQGSM
jgi:septal ring factor EnvC (AmiA/AmiB activator)